MLKKQLDGLRLIKRMAQQSHQRRLVEIDRRADQRQWKILERSVTKVMKKIYHDYYGK